MSGWDEWIQRYLDPFVARYRRPFIPHENGCFSLRGAENWRGYFYQRAEAVTTPIDLNAQANLYSAFLQAFADVDSYMGPSFFWYHFLDLPVNGGRNDRDMSPRLKPAEQVMRTWWLGDVPRPIVDVSDGVSDEWPGTALTARDPMADQTGTGDDLLSLRALEDDSYIYLALEYAKSPAGGLAIWVDTTGDRVPEYHIGIDDSGVWDGVRRWVGYVRRSANWQFQECIGVLDVAVTGTLIEARLHKRFLDGDERRKSIYVADHNADWSGLDDEIPGWFAVPLAN